MYLTFEEYTHLGGQIDCETAYNPLEFKACKLIDMHTFGRLSGLADQNEAIQRLIVELVDLYVAEESNAVSSISNDGYSETYTVIEYEKKAEHLIYEYLSTETYADGTPLLYRGV